MFIYGLDLAQKTNTVLANQYPACSGKAGSAQNKEKKLDVLEVNDENVLFWCKTLVICPVTLDFAFYSIT